MKNAVETYIEKFPLQVKNKLIRMRQLIKENAPLANEGIKYGMPTLMLNGNLVHYAAMKNHIGFYPTPSAIERFKKEIAHYKSSKGAIQFPLDENLPEDLIVEIVKFRVTENKKKIKN